MSDELENLKSEDVSIGDRPFSIPSELPILPLRDTVLFPNSFMPLAVARESSVRLIDDAIANGKLIAVFTQRDAAVEEPKQEDLFSVGTATHIHKMFKLPDGSLRLIVQGLARLTLDEVVATDPYLRARVSTAADDIKDADRLEIDALARNIKTNFQQVVSLSPLLSDDLQTLAMNISEPGRLADFIASSLSTISTAVETGGARDARRPRAPRQPQPDSDQGARGARARFEDPVAGAVRSREEPARVLPARADEGDPEGARRRRRPDQGHRGADREDRGGRDAGVGEEGSAARAGPAGEDAGRRPPNTRSRGRISTGSSRCRGTSARDEVIDLKLTKGVLDADHSGLEKAKDRILEYLAVRKLNPEVKGPILCFVGPPGVGKTSLAKSIARSLDRKFVRVSLGGMRDEAEIRGHRRTYIGALPGQIIQGLRRAETKNPVFILDEIDKLGSDFRGDPSSALLEVLDPGAEQHVPRSLSRRAVRSVRGAVHHDGEHPRSGPGAAEGPHGGARDRRLYRGREAEDRDRPPGGQAGEEPRAHARIHPVYAGRPASGDSRLHPRGRRAQPRARDRRRSAARWRAAARRATRRRSSSRRTSSSRCSARREFLDEEMEERTKEPGVAIGLAWTPAGGEVLFIEASRMAGTGSLTLTGQLGDVMKESARAALSWLRTHAKEYGIDPDFFKSAEMHVHVPSGAIPKDGPSAGVTMATAMASQLTGRPVRGDLAMTGEITLSGRVLPIGGVKEKVLAARRVGIREVILPKANAKNVDEDLTPELRRDMTVHLVSTIDEVLALALQPVSSDVRPLKTEPKEPEPKGAKTGRPIAARP